MHKLPPTLNLLRFSGREREDVLSEVEALRVVVWKASGFPLRAENQTDTHWGDDWDLVATHFVIQEKGKVIAATRVTRHISVTETPYPDWFAGITPEPRSPVLFISRLVVHPQYQRQGLGDYLDNACIELGRVLHAGAILCDVPEYRIESLLKRGWTLTSEPKLGVVFPTMLFSGMMLRLPD